jgi:SAM-dependent methyltransferase
MEPDKEIIQRWKNSAPFWEKNHENVRHLFAPIAQELAADAKIASGQTVLDVATEPGEPALSVAPLVGAGGTVVGVDPIPEMIDAARRAAERFGIKNARFEVAFADQLPFPDATFDAVISRFGVMFFPSPVDGIREMLRVLKPAGKLALAVWYFAERNPFFTALSRVVERFVESPPLAPDALDAFRFATLGKLLDVFSQAGVVAPTERILQFKIEAPVSIEEFWTLRLELSEVLREKLAKLTEEQRKEVKRLALEAFREYSTDAGISFPGEILIVSGAKSSAA